MALDERYIPVTLLNEYFVDKDSGLPLAGGKLYFYDDNDRATPKTVYKLTGTPGNYTYSPLPNPVTLSSVGTVQDASGNNTVIYLYPYENNPETNQLELNLYYIVCESSTGVRQFTREAVPSLNASSDPVGASGLVTNQLANPQFSQYFLLDESTNLTVTGTNTTFPIAPDWDLVASGSGTITIQRVPVSGNEALPTYPTYYLSISTGAGVTNPYLRQRLTKNSGLWSEKYVAGFFAARVNPGNNAVSLIYQDSSGVNSNVPIVEAQIATTWSQYGNSVLLDSSSNTQSGDNAYVDIILTLPLQNTINVTSLQVTTSEGEFSQQIVPYDTRSANRDQALMSDYYVPNLLYRPADSLVYCWDFPKNPRQFGDSGSVGSGTAQYVWDQTILQTTAGLTVNYSASTQTGGLTLNHQNQDRAYALIQYLDQEDARKFIGSPICVNVNGYTTAGSFEAGNTTVRVHIYANAASNQFSTLPATMFNLSNDGIPSLTPGAVINGWYEIPRSTLPGAKGDLTPLSSYANLYSKKDLEFNGWAVTDNAQVLAGITGVAVVVTISPEAATTQYNTHIDSINVLPGNVPSRPYNKSLAETLQDAQRYYEKSFSGTSATNAEGAIVVSTPITNFTGSGACQLRSGNFSIEWKTEKRAAPFRQFYNYTTGGTDSVRIIFSSQGNFSTYAANATFSSGWSIASVGKKGALYSRSGTTAYITQSFNINDAVWGYMIYHYSADARLGVIA